MNQPFELQAAPELHAPVLVVALEGWIDAGSGAANAMAAMVSEFETAPLATFAQDLFIDYRARRPTMQIRDGVSTGLIWPSIELLSAKDSAGQDLVLLTGVEPDSNWRLFLEAVGQLSKDLEVRMEVSFGAYPSASPHTRPPLVSVNASTTELAECSGLIRNSVDVPAGVAAAIADMFAANGLPAMGLWAQVPHYAAGMPYPGASVALLDTLRQVAGIQFEATELREAAASHRLKLDELVSQSTEHQTMVQQLEEAHDAMLRASDGIVGPGEALPSGEELAAELERFLRDQGR